MIRIRRGPEPDTLRTARRKHLSRAILAWARGATARDDGGTTIAFSGYDVAREALWLAQERKCAYCERTAGLDNQPVEHFRPKAGAVRGDPLVVGGPQTTDDDHYWWLAWTWENLFFACNTCNGKGTKGNWFPLQQGTVACTLPPREALADLPDTWRRLPVEQPMLVDPAGEDPMDLIEWRPENPQAPWSNLRWKPFGRDPAKRGATTIAILKLDRELPDHVSEQIRAHVLPKMERLRGALAGANRAAADGAWDELEMVLAPPLPHLAATYDAIEWLLDQPSMAGVRAFVGRALPRPGAAGVDPPSTDIDDAPTVRSLPAKLRLQVRAGWPNAKEGILALCAHAAWEVDELAMMIVVSTVYIRMCCRALEEEGRLVCQVDGGGRQRFALAAPRASA